jgi:hypothetical protein
MEYMLVGFANMITAEDCHRKAAEWLGQARGTSDPETIAGIKRASDAWTALARQIEEAEFRRPRARPPINRPVDLAKSLNPSHADSVKVADLLRERLRLSDDAEDAYQ